MSLSQRLSHQFKKNEFIALMAMLTSTVALAVDSMLPAFPMISRDFNISEPSQIQMIIAVLFLGHAPGQIIFGPMADAMGRKKPIYIGLFFFIIGSILSGVAPNFEIFLAGRFLQGFGGAAPRIISRAIIRDKYSGNAMAQITSLVTMFFILIPAIAPALGQGILFFGHWRAIFTVLFLFGILVWIWFYFRQEETLAHKNRRKFNMRQLKYGFKETFSQTTTFVCIIASGLVFGILIAYLGSVKKIFSSQFGITTEFPLYFGSLAISIGLASFSNSKLVMTFGMRRLILIAFAAMALLANLFSIYLLVLHDGAPPLWLFMGYMLPTFFTLGLLFGNLNALAMEPIGHVAGIGSSLLGFTQNIIAVILGVGLGQFFHGSVVPLVLSFGTISMFCLALVLIESKFQKSVAEKSDEL